MRAVITDMGVERFLPSSPDVLPELYELVEGRRVLPDHDAQWLLPGTMMRNGWQQSWDKVLKWGLSSLTWFQAWLELLKSLNNFLRNDVVMEELCRQLRD